jgi:hypothetical protein
MTIKKKTGIMRKKSNLSLFYDSEDALLVASFAP